MRMSRKRRRSLEKRRRLEEDLGHVKMKGAYLAAASLLFWNAVQPANLYAMPAGGQVAAGQAAIHQAGATMTIQQQTAQAILNWRSFGILPGEQVNFLQPNAQAVALNRVLGNDPSAIYGKLTANGKVFLVNPNGVFFAPGAQVNAGGMLATTLSITDADFMAGNYKFVNQGNAQSVVNQGNLVAENQGLVALLAPEVKNEGVIAAKKGSVMLAAGNQATLDFSGDGKISLAVTEGALRAVVENKGMIEADGGIVLMTARGGQDLASSAVNQSGIIRAQSLDGQTGAVTVDAQGGAVKINGTIDASGTNVHGGGTIDVFGKDITLGDSAKLDVSGEKGGAVRIGGDWQGAGDAPHADSVTIENGAVIHADAGQNGNGGKVVVWSDGTTKFDGAITAQGGAVGGDGGKVETSGHTLRVGGSVDASAANGAAGEWLLDPESITISSADSGSGTTSWLSADTVKNTLNGGTSMTVKTTDNNITGHAGNITVQDDITVNPSSDVTLTLDAVANIDVNANIESTGGKLDVNLKSLTTKGTVGGDIVIAAGKSIKTNGGNVQLYSGMDDKYNKSVSVNGTIDTSAGGGTGGNITIYGSESIANALTIGSSGKLASGGGNITLQSHSIVNAGTIDSGAGALLLKGDKMSLAGNISGTGTAKVQTLTAGKTISVGSGSADLELGNVFGGSSGFSDLEIGDAQTANLTVNGADFGGNVTLNGKTIAVNGSLDAGGKNVTLNAGASAAGTGVITAAKLDLQGTGADFTLTGGNKVDALSGNVKSVAFTNDKDLAIDAAGLRSANGAIDLTAQGALALQGTVKSGSGDISLKLNGITGTAAAGGLVQGTGKLTIDRAAAGEISLGGASGTGLHLGSSAFGPGNTLFGSNFNKGVFIGGGNTDKITVGGALTVGDALTVTSRGAMDFLSGGAVRTGGNENLTLTADRISFAGSNGLGAGTGVLTMNADSITGWGNLTFDNASGQGTLAIAPKTNTKQLYIGGASESDQLAVTGEAFGKIAAANYKNVRLGQGDQNGVGKGSGDVYLYGGVWVLPQNLTVNGGAGHFVSGTLGNASGSALTLNLDSLEQTAGTVFDIGGKLALNGTGSGAFELNSTANLNLGSFTAKNLGGLDVYSQSLGIGGAGILSTGDISFTTDKITGVGGQVKTDGDIFLKTITSTKDINIGVGSGGLDLTADWMKKFVAGGGKWLTIGGDTGYTGSINVKDTSFGSALKLLTDHDSGIVNFTGNITAGSGGSKDMWIYTWEFNWTGVKLFVHDLTLDIGKGLGSGGTVTSQGGELIVVQPAGKDLYLTNNSSEVLAGGYQIAYDVLNGMKGFDDLSVTGDKNIYIYDGALKQSVDITAADNVTLNGQVELKDGAKEVKITGDTITLNSGAGIAVGNNALTLTTDTLTDNTGGGSAAISGNADGELTVKQRTAGTELSIGSSGGGLHFTQSQLNGGLFDTQFGNLTLGSAVGGNVNTYGDVALNNNLTIQAGAGSKIDLGGDLTIGADGNGYKVTLKGGTIQNNNHKINAGTGTLNLYGNTFALTPTLESATVLGSGVLGIGAYDDNGAISLGDTAHGGLQLKNDFFANVFDGFDSYKIGNGGSGQTIYVDKSSLTKNTILDAGTVTFTGGGMQMSGGNTTLTIKAQKATQDADANLTVENLDLQGGNTGNFTLLNGGNTISGTVTGNAHDIKVAANELHVGALQANGAGGAAGNIELASDKISFTGGPGSIKGQGELYVHQTSGKDLYLGSASGTSGLALNSDAFSTFGTGFRQVSLGNKDGLGLINADGALDFNNHTEIYGYKIITGSTTYWKMGGGKNLTLTTDALDLQGKIEGHGGDLTLRTFTQNRDLSLGTAEHGASGSSLFLQSGYFDGSGGVGRVFYGDGTIYLGRADGTGTLYQTGKTQFYNDVVILQGSEAAGGGYYASGDINTGGKDFTVESLKAEFDNAHVTTGAGAISIKTDDLTIDSGSWFKGSGGLALDAYTDTKTITIGSGGTGLNLAAGWFGTGGAFAGVSGGVSIGSTGNTGGIHINENLAVNGNDLTLQSGGTISGNGSITLSGAERDFSVSGAGGANLTGQISVGTLTGSSSGGSLTFGNAANNISGIGDLTAKKNIEVKNAGGLTISGTVSGAADGGKDAVAITTGGGNLTIGAGGKVVSNNGDITLTASGADGHFINNGGSTALTLNSGGRWLVYTHDSLGDNFGGLTGDFRKYGMDSAGSGKIPLTGNGSAHFYQPEATIYAEKTYGEANNEFFDNGSFKITINDADGGTKRMNDDKVFLGNRDDFELISGQDKADSYTYGHDIQNNDGGVRYDGQEMDVNQNIGGTGANGQAYGTDNSDANKQIHYMDGKGQNYMNYDVNVEFWVKPREITVGANNDSVDYSQLGSNGYQGNAANPDGVLNGSFGNGWGIGGFVNGESFDSAKGHSGAVNGYNGNSQGAFAPGGYQIGLNGNLYADNYVFTYMPGTLTITDETGSYVPPKPIDPPGNDNPPSVDYPPNNDNPIKNDSLTGAIGTANQVTKPKPADSLPGILAVDLPPLMGDIDLGVSGMNLEGMVSIVDVIAAADYPQGNMELAVQGRSNTFQLYANRSGFGMTLDGDEEGYDQAHSRTDGAIPVLYTDYSSLGTDHEQELDGFYSVIYTPERLSIQPEAQGQTTPRRSEIGKPELRQDYAVAYDNAELGVFLAAIGNGIVTIHPQDDQALETVNHDDKAPLRAVLTAGVLRSIRDFGIAPDQLRAVYIFREKKPLPTQARKG